MTETILSALLFCLLAGLPTILLVLPQPRQSQPAGHDGGMTAAERAEATALYLRRYGGTR